MENREYKLPAIVWLRVTDYMHGWIQYELGGGARVKDQKVVCTFDLPGAREVLRMETQEEMLDPRPVGNSMSDTWKNCIEAGLALDGAVTERLYGITTKKMKLFVPVECPRRCMTKNGVLRPWTLNVNFGKRQARMMQDLLRNEFWKAVAEFDRRYAARMGGRKYPAVDMIEDFCRETGTPDLYAEAMRREWQRRVKRGKKGDV